MVSARILAVNTLSRLIRTALCSFARCLSVRVTGTQPGRSINTHTASNEDTLPSSSCQSRLRHTAHSPDTTPLFRRHRSNSIATEMALHTTAIVEYLLLSLRTYLPTFHTWQAPSSIVYLNRVGRWFGVGPFDITSSLPCDKTYASCWFARCVCVGLLTSPLVDRASS